MQLDDFRNLVARSRQELYRDFFRRRESRIRIQKEHVAVRNFIRISDATLALSNQKGFSAMSMRDLSAASGLSIGALYAYFSSKNELLDMIQQESIRLATRVIESRIEGIDDPRRKLRQAISAHLYLSEVMHPWFYFAFMETKNLKKEARRKAIEIELRMEQIFIDIITEGRQAGIYRQVDQALTAAMIKALLQDWYLKRWKHSRREITLDAYAGFVVEVVESYLLALPAGCNRH